MRIDTYTHINLSKAAQSLIFSTSSTFCLCVCSRDSVNHTFHTIFCKCIFQAFNSSFGRFLNAWLKSLCTVRQIVQPSHTIRNVRSATAARWQQHKNVLAKREWEPNLITTYSVYLLNHNKAKLLLFFSLCNLLIFVTNWHSNRFNVRHAQRYFLVVVALYKSYCLANEQRGKIMPIFCKRFSKFW